MRRRRNDGLLDDLFKASNSLFRIVPIWVGPCVAFAAFALFRWGVPLFTPKEGPFAPLAAMLCSLLGWGVGGIILLAWISAEVYKLTNRNRLDAQTGRESVRLLSWRDFEELIGECYRRRGYLAEVVGNSTGDGGVDIELRGHGKLLLVQCKHWKVLRVGVQPVRELLGVMTSRRADGAVLATSGTFTSDALDFARDNRIELLDGPALERLLRDFQRPASGTAAPIPASAPAPASPTRTQPAPTPACPQCGRPMVRRTARRGSNAGSAFWGCPTYPACKGTR